MKKIGLLNFALANATLEEKATKKALDRQAILAMEGRYYVDFDFAETFSPIEGYEREDLYKNASVEYIFVIKDEPDYISIQHILVVDEKFVVKHWRQDWIYENRELLVYDKNLTWKKKMISVEEAAGTWTQKVYQVDDSPRYEGYGTWVFVDGKKYWKSVADAPLPRRQNHRDDYNVLKRGTYIEITDTGWRMDQDNQKIFRNDKGEDQLVVWEKGFEVESRGDYNCQPAIDYWEKNHQYWADVREIWTELIEENEELSFKEEIDGSKMYEPFFGMAMRFSGDKYNKAEVQKAIYATIQSYLKRG